MTNRFLATKVCRQVFCKNSKTGANILSRQMRDVIHKIKAYMINLILGILLGFTLTIWYLVFDMQLNFDHIFSVNIVIAMASVTATAIHFDSVRRQRKDRVWEINKENLINLSKAISDAIEISSKLSEREFNNMQGIPDDTDTDGAKEINDTFRKTISHSLNVYKPLLNSELTDAIEKYQKEEKSIEEDFNHDAIRSFEAYDRQWAAQKELHKVVSSFIKGVAGIEVT